MYQIKAGTFLLLAMGCFPYITSAEIIYESGSLGLTGITMAELSSQTISSINANNFVFAGARFQIDQATKTTRIGGHFVAEQGGATFFGAVVSLSDEADFPDTADLSSSDVLGVAQLIIPDSSDEVFGNLSLTLQTGWYAVVFGSGLFETSGRGAVLENGLDINSPSYIGWEINVPDTGWFNLHEIGDFENHHFVVEGAIIPEPATTVLLGTCGVLLLLKRRRAV